MSSHLTAPGRHLGRSILRFIAASTALGLATVGLLTPVAAIIGVYGADVVNIAKTLPASLANVEMQSPSTLYGKLDGKDVAFATFYEKNRVPLTAEEIPDVVKNAVVSIEDPRFYEHGGVDFAAVMRAVLQNQSSGSTQSGASTITMQLVRNLRIESAEWEDNEDAIDSAREETASRKLLEMRYAIGLEHNYTKEQILTSYLNYASFGGNVYGIGAAAQYYYGKDAKDLTLPEAAQLVSVFPSPNSYRVDVADNLDRAKARRDLVLQRMVDRGYIDQAAADEAIATPITPHITQQPRGCEVAEHNAAYFCDYVVNLIRNDSTFGDTADDRTALLRRGGLQIYTSIDLSLQDEVQADIDKHVNRSDKIGAASTVVQVGTGRVLAMGQNRTYSQTNGDGTDLSRTAVNYNTNYDEGGSSGFPGGSTYKAFTLIDWLKQGHTLDERVYAPAGTYYQKNFPDRCKSGGWAGTWSLENAESFPSSFDVRYATKHSINSGFAAMAEQLDLCDIRDTAVSFGITTQANGEELDHQPASVIGTNNVSPIQMASAYAGIANDGTYCTPQAILRVVDGSNGSERPVTASQCSQATTAQVARTATSALTGVFDKDGTAAKAATGDGSAIAGKTGSTDNYHQTWLVGYTTSTAQATWVGNGTGLAKSDLRYYSIKGTAGWNVRYALFKDIQTDIHTSYPGAASFPDPNDTSATARTLPVPDVTGQDPEAARGTLEQAGFQVAISPEQRASTAAAGTVAETDPPANTMAGANALITVYLSNGQTPTATPSPTPSTSSASPSASANSQRRSSGSSSSKTKTSTTGR